MSTFVCNKREKADKVKKLRREGIVPGVIFGKNLDASISIKFQEKAFAELIKADPNLSQIELDLDGEKYNAMVKTVDYVHMSKKIQHIEFQVLTSGEKIKTTLNLNFINGDKITLEGNIQEYLNQIEYEVLPKDMLDSLDVDLSGLTYHDSITVSDLSIYNDDRYHVLTKENATIATLAPFNEVVLETEEEEGATVEAPVIGEEEAAE